MAGLRTLLLFTALAGGLVCLAIIVGDDLLAALASARRRAGAALRPEQVRVALAQAGLDSVPVPAWILGRIGASVVAGAVAWAWFGLPVLGVIAFLVTHYIIGVALEVRRRRFETRRQESLLEAVRHGIAVMSRSGSATQMLEALAASGPHEVRPIFQEVIAAGGFGPGGIAFAEAIDRVQERLADPLFDDMALALSLHWRQGGKLVPALEALAGDWTETLRLQQEAKSVRAGVEASVLLLALLPFVFLVTLQVLAPALLAPFRSAAGEVVLGLAVAWMAIGYGVLQRMSQPPRESRLQLRRTAG